MTPPIKPSFLQPSLGAMVGAILGAIGGLFALGIAPAILWRDATAFRAYPTLSTICWFISGGAGWGLGGLIGPRLNARFNHPKAEIAGGVVGGLIPVILIALLGWHLARP